MSLTIPPPGNVDPCQLVEARLLAHWAVQIPAALGSHLIEPRDDDSHSSLEWLGDERGMLVGHPLGNVPAAVIGLRVGVGLDPFELLILEPAGDVVAQRALDGDTLEAALEWVRGRLESRGQESLTPTPFRDYDMPDHPVARGAPFAPREQGEGLRELGRWFAGMSAVLTQVAAHWRDDERVESLAPVRLWPHHFDLGSLVRLQATGKEDALDSIGFGFEPGDEAIPQPYLYVNPYPRLCDTPAEALPGGGVWHDAGFFGAALDGERLLASKEDPWSRARSFVDEALEILLDA